MWQESLIDPELPPTAYQSSPNISPAQSMLSLGSSHPFDLNDDNGNSLTNLHLDALQSPHKSSVSLPVGQSALGICRNDSNKRNRSLQYHSADSSSVLYMADHIDSDQPKCSWRSNSMTPCPPWGRIVKARDLDSGCPGSEQSTRMSHNASLDQLEQSDIPHMQSSLEAAGNTNIPSCTVAAPQQICHYEEKDCADDCLTEFAHKGLCKSSSHSLCIDRDVKHNSEASPSSDLVTIAFPKTELCQMGELVDNSVAQKIGTLSSNKVNGNGSRSRWDKYNLEQQQLNQNYRYDRPESTDCSNREGSQKRTKSRNSGTSKDAIVSIRDEEDMSESPRGQYRSLLKKSEMRPAEASEKCRGMQNSGTSSTFFEKGQNRKNNSTFSTERHSQYSNLNRYRERYVSGNSSDVSDASSYSQNSSSNIHKNISKLKRDLNIIKSQMMNLSSEVFQDRRRKEEESCRRNSPDLKSRRRQKPIKALDVSFCSEDSEQDSDIMVSDFPVSHLSEREKCRSSRSRPSSFSRRESQTTANRGLEKCNKPSPADKHFLDPKESKSLQISNSSLEMMSESVIADSEMDSLPKSTPKTKRSPSRERSVRVSLSPVKLKSSVVVGEKRSEGIKRKLFNGTVAGADGREQATDGKEISESFKCSFFDIKHAAVQTEDKEEGLSVSKLSLGKTLEEVQDKVSRVKHQDQTAQMYDGRLQNGASPVIYIENYKYAAVTCNI